MTSSPSTLKANCIRQVSNWSSIKTHHRFEQISAFDREQFLKDMSIASPKMVALFEKIHQLDEADWNRDKKHYKHIIYSDVKQLGYGAKIIASAFYALGYKSYYDTSLRPVTTTQKDTFALLSSTITYGKTFPVSLRRNIIATFNERPKNIYGEQIRFIILDSGYKEGVDLFDVKYVHLFEPALTLSDEKQAVGRGTRFCGQKGLDFHPTLGWPLQVYRYEVQIPIHMQSKLHETQLFPLFLKYSGIDIRKILFAKNLEDTAIIGAVDRLLTKNIHQFQIRDEDIDIALFKDLFTINNSPSSSDESDADSNTDTTLTSMDTRSDGIISTSGDLKYKFSPMDIDTPPLSANARRKNKDGGGKKKKQKKQKLRPKAPQKMYSFPRLRTYIQERYGAYAWPKVTMENLCTSKANGGSIEANAHMTKFTPTQEFVRLYFQSSSIYKGLLAWHSVGTGKTCTAIATASSSFERDGYTILWVTRHTLKPDIWKNMFNQVCSVVLKNEWKKGKHWPSTIDAPMRYVSDRWLAPISYKQFSNLLKGKNKLYQELVQRNGAIDPLRKTLIIIDEAHKLYASDLPTQERPDVNILKKMIHKSYRLSQSDSVRLLLMTATPYTSEPMDLIKLLNLLRTEESAIPEDFDAFSKTYLDENGDFTIKTKYNFLNDIAGYISYLNREKDARQFAYPVYEDVYVPMTEDITKRTKIQLKELEHRLEEYELNQKEQKATKKEVQSKLKKDTELALEQYCKDAKPKKPCQDRIREQIREKRERIFTELGDKMKEKEQEIKITKQQIHTTKKTLHYQEKTDLSQERALRDKCKLKQIISPKPKPASKPKSKVITSSTPQIATDNMSISSTKQPLVSLPDGSPMNITRE